MKKKVLVAMSGGVDSSVTAALLIEQGYEVGGATIRTWAPNDCENLNTRACCGLTGVEDAQDVADRLNIPYWVFNFEKKFRENVVDYFKEEYQKGRTPNPCIACNEHVKFRQFLDRARELGYEYIATGHYAQMGFDEETKRHFIAEGRDSWKDQSYVLFPLDEDVMAHTLLPLGSYTKDQIRDKARELDLVSVMDKPDSQEICFIPSNDYGNFLEKEYSKENEQLIAGRGVVRSTSGEILGEHEGYYHYTRGQRRGLGIASSDPLYVVDILPEKNEVIVGLREEAKNPSCRVSRMNWFLPPNNEEVFEASVKIRAHHHKAIAKVKKINEFEIEVVFDESQDAITPGQAAVVYIGERVLGGGWINSVD